MIRLSIEDLAATFPDFRVALVVLDAPAGIPERPPALASFIATAEADCRSAWGASELSAIPAIAAWRRAYKGFGIRSTSYRSSVERLIKRVLAGDSLPSINSFVDLYNAISLKHGLCLGADDLDRAGPDLAFRFAREDDSFIDMAPGEGLPAEQAPKAGEVVYAAGSTILCRRWNWRQDARSIVRPDTARIVLTVQSNGHGSVEAAASELVQLAGEMLGMKARMAIADRSGPAIAIE